jgi:hypothetical protein
MARALLVAVNPVFGLYTLMLATPIGALFTSAVFMNVSTTSQLASGVAILLNEFLAADIKSPFSSRIPCGS